MLGSFMKGVKDSLGPARSVAPEGLRRFGLAKKWPKGSALTGGSAELDFLKNAASSLMAMSSVDPLEHDKLFTAHGRKMAAVFAALVKKKLARG